MDPKDIQILSEGLTLGMRWNDIIKLILEYTKTIGDLTIYGIIFTKEDTEESIAKKLFLERSVTNYTAIDDEMVKVAEPFWCQTRKTPV
jgi:hypothetical protein